MAAQAGCDVLRFGASAEAQVEGMEAVIRALESAELPFRQADDADERVRALKESYLVRVALPDAEAARQAAGRFEHRALAAEIAARAGMAV